MRAAYASALNPESPLDGLVLGERPEPEERQGWTTVRVKAASLNHHDLWTLRGVGISGDRLPMILGCDAAGVDTATGDEVVVHSVISADGWSGDETLDPGRSLLSEKHQGTMAELVTVPSRNVLLKPAELSFAEAACLPTAWLTAYRMLFVNSHLRPGNTVLVQGASGGVASACIGLARAAGLRVWATARTEVKQAAALELGAHESFASGARLPERVDAVMETVGAATWSHSLKSLRPGGQVVISGATSGAVPPAELNRIFFLQLQVIGSTMGTKAELADLMSFLRATGLRPRIDRTLPLDRIAEGLTAMESGSLIGKIVIEP
ncbi:zinc-binding dehydrogenase [Jatrophihabitans lederbergiae]|uniref:Zinc-binding dehydrogenase n=1 Tax=Jatrophihabitans lederbergiae TaxID=3075547 RepID=A0ABU2J708_9ACTN|nr:zinc-binding dehydrogenase [Jatrophihabitans sp. DSM 44399]MDT0260394.1 zinc-binding dehydrogenase [Jatrophihabitans sp. DSM 44399]